MPTIDNLKLTQALFPTNGPRICDPEFISETHHIREHEMPIVVDYLSSDGEEHDLIPIGAAFSTALTQSGYHYTVFRDDAAGGWMAYAGGLSPSVDGALAAAGCASELRPLTHDHPIRMVLERAGALMFGMDWDETLNMLDPPMPTPEQLEADSPLAALRFKKN